jgi:hypothetical protein
MSVDASRFQDYVTFIWILWSAPLQIIVAIYMLWQQLGPSVLAGLCVMVILLPVTVIVAGRQRALQVRCNYKV